MIPYFITIIIIIVCLEIYLRYYTIKTELTKKQLCDEASDTTVEEPWDKIDVDKDKNKYYIKINNFDQNKFEEWKKLPLKIEYDSSNKYFIIKTKSEENALAIANLFIANMNNEIDFQYIVDNDMINISRLKAKTYTLVKKKLIELIKEGSMKSNNIEYFNSNDHFDTSEIDYNMTDENEGILVEQLQVKEEPEIIKPIQNNVEEVALHDEPIEKMSPFGSMFSAYGGCEYATISF
jgi:hypothetical protein